ncbi:receptor-like protein 2 [Brachypodium distachyon]|uniref:Leucine-rich repeat-containing N-terminal plant-type domain-containing protein n=1 Tax=Brachypodium distachyon TaxID=15368 RepID=A0A0Q3KZI2_BRADI|nr:receptor-like protein 2 [Brachypodium distachyon]KQJ85477.1 hypothetical protein BRADI_5g27340v3 [Brachypodium distachyon]|eukprot:XP_003580884.2 receptor-like protein 2 [Brachypodium distachyon]
MAKYWLLLQLLSALLILPAATSTAASCHPDDLRALRGFAGNLSGGAAVLLRAAWSGASCCGWEGVRCDDGASGRVTTLWLPGRGLVGPIHGASSLAGLAQLESLNLANNRLHVGTTFPSWIGELDRLCYLDLSHNASPLHVKRNRRTLADGKPNTITGTNNSVKSGNGNTISGNDNVVISGNNNVVSGNHNKVVSGSDNAVSGNMHVVSGTHHVVTGTNNTVSGSNNAVSGSNHIVSGSNKVVTGG